MTIKEPNYLQKKKKKMIIKIVLITIPCIACLLLCLSCQNNNETLIEPLSDEEILSNLLTMKGIVESVYPELLIGEWELVEFAYTADGKSISNERTISMLSAINSHSTKNLMIKDEDPFQYMSDAPLDLFGPWVFLNKYLFFAI
ncbi:MAG: hypothetical protein LBC84_09835, partial [Prevotellaceae bacterium]|nr:hypothetical protein [Prevotellaceae bacterium]